jgi:hypothetical protein
MVSESSEDETMVVKKGRRLHKDNPLVQKVINVFEQFSTAKISVP